MKLRILPFIAVSFAILLAGRAAVVSSTVIKTVPNDVTPNAHSNEEGRQHDKPKPTLLEKTSSYLTSGNSGAQREQCLTAEVASIFRNDMKVFKARKIKMEQREAALLTLESKLTEQLETVEAANITLDARIKTLKNYANEDITHLVNMYETMKAKQAAEIFNSMDPAFAAGFLREMNSNKAGLIMASMDPRKSYAISIIIAGRNASYRE